MRKPTSRTRMNARSSRSVPTSCERETVLSLVEVSLVVRDLLPEPMVREIFSVMVKRSVSSEAHWVLCSVQISTAGVRLTRAGSGSNI